MVRIVSCVIEKRVPSGIFYCTNLAYGGERLLELSFSAGGGAELRDESRVLNDIIVEQLRQGEHEVWIVWLVHSLLEVAADVYREPGQQNEKGSVPRHSPTRFLLWTVGGAANLCSRRIQKQTYISISCLEKFLPMPWPHGSIPELHDYGKLGLEGLRHLLEPGCHFRVHLRGRKNTRVYASGMKGILLVDDNADVFTGLSFIAVVSYTCESTPRQPTCAEVKR